VHDAKTLPRSYFRRYDESNDRIFYTHPRLTAHIDKGAIAALGKFFLQELPFCGDVLDLMSSYRSHIPAGLKPRTVVGLGLNAEEMRQNEQLTDFCVHDLNQDPMLPFENASFDGALCTVSVQYLIHPVEVFADVGRVLRPGAPFILSFSNRCFPSKAVQVWLMATDSERGDLIEMYLHRAGCFGDISVHNISPCRIWGDPLYAVRGVRA
jgi:SAM-dependent methyltransferase